MPRAVEGKKTEDPMFSVWSEKVKNTRINKTARNKQIIYNSNDAAVHWSKTNNIPPDKIKLYKKIVEEYFHELSKNIIQKNYPYTWYKIGEFYIAKFNGSPIVDLYKSREHKKLLSFVNLHTSGWVYVFYWAKKRSIFHNRDIYDFKPVPGKEYEVGKKGVKTWIKKLHDDNKLTDYNAFVRNDAMRWKRAKKREELKEKRRLENEQKIRNIINL